MGGDRGGGRGGGEETWTCPWKITSCHLFPRRKKLERTSLEKQSPPPPTPVGVVWIRTHMSDGGMLFFICSRFSYLTDCADTQVDLRLCCLHATAIRYIRNGVNKANPDKTSRSPQSCSNANCVELSLNKNDNANLSINLVIQQDAFSNIFFLSQSKQLLRCSLVYYSQPPSGTKTSTFIVYVSSYAPGKTERMCRLV